MEGLYRREGSPYYWFRFAIEGKVINRTTRCTDLEAARAKAEEIRVEEERRAVGLPGCDQSARLTPNELLSKFLEDRGRACSSDHLATLGQRVGAFFVGLGSLRDLTPDRIRATLASIAAQPLTNRLAAPGEEPHRRSPQTLNGYLRSLNTFFRWLIKQRLWRHNPAALVEEYAEGDPVVEYRPMRRDELRAFFTSVPEQRIAAYLLSATDGLRKGELRRLRVGDVVLSPAQGQIPHLRVRRSTAKNKRACTLPLHPQVLPFLAPLLEGRDPSESLFAKGLATHETFARDVAAAGLVRKTHEGVLTWTSLRKSLATLLDEQGVPAGGAAEGHEARDRGAHGRRLHEVRRGSTGDGDRDAGRDPARTSAAGAPRRTRSHWCLFFASDPDP